MSVMEIMKKKIVFVVLGAAACIGIAVITLTDYSADRVPYGIVPKEIINVSADEDLVPIGEILDGNVIQQTFIATEDAISGIKLKAATYARKNSGMLIVELINMQDQKTLEKWKMDVSYLKDNDYLSLELINEPYNLSGKECMIKISSEGASEGNAVTLYTYQNNIYSDGELKVNGRLQTGSLCFKVMGIEEKVNLFHTKIWLRIYEGFIIIGILSMAYKTTVTVKGK